MCVYISIYVCIHVCMHACMYVCTNLYGMTFNFLGWHKHRKNITKQNRDISWLEMKIVHTNGSHNPNMYCTYI